MSKYSVHRLVFLIFSFFWQVVLHASIVTVEFEGTINSATPANTLTDKILNGDIFRGTYTYDTSIQDCQGPNADAKCETPSVGLYENSVAELYIQFLNKSFYWHLGNFRGTLTGQVKTLDMQNGDTLQISSTDLLANAGTKLNTNALQYMQLTFLGSLTTPSFLSNDALPLVKPPDSVPALVCLRFASVAVPPLQCGLGGSDIVLKFSAKGITRTERLQWANPLPQGNSLQDIIWNDARKLYVAVGQNGAILTSSNGQAWVNRDVQTTNKIYAVAVNNDTFVAVSQDKIITSLGGIVWSATEVRPDGSSWAYRDIIWDGRKFVIVGYQIIGENNNEGKQLIYTSVDGTTWLKSFPTGSIISKIAYNGSTYVILTTYPTKNLMTSMDLFTWTKAAVQTTGTIYDITWGGGTFVGVGSQGTVVTSSNGSDWVPRVSGTSTQIVGIDWVNNKFVAVGNSGLIVTGSADGVTWQSIMSGTKSNLLASASNGNEIISVGRTGEIIQTTDNSNGLRVSSGIVENINDVVWTGAEFIAVGDLGNIATSSNGVDWIFQLPLTSQNIRGVATHTIAGSGTHVAVGANGIVYRSVDPKTTWTLVRGENSSVDTLDDLRKVMWVEKQSQFIAIGNKGLIITSGDGTNWTTQVSGENVELVDIATRDDLVVIVGKSLDVNKALVKTSIDGVLWQTQIIETDNPIRRLTSVTWSGNEFLATANSSFDLLHSKDGVNWNSGRSNSPSHRFAILSFVRWVGNHYMGFGIDRTTGLNYLFTSQEGLTWKTQPAYFNAELNFGIAHSSDNLVLVSNGGSINYQTGSYVHNFAPFTDLGPDQFVKPRDRVTLVATVNDGAGVTVTDYTFSETTLNANLIDLNPDPLIFEFTAPSVPEQTTFVFTLIATDDQAVTSTDKVRVIVAPNQKPVAATVANIGVASESKAKLVGTGTDPDGDSDALTYAWRQVSGQAMLLSGATTAILTFDAPHTVTPLPLVFGLVVTDERGLFSDEVFVSVTILAATQVANPTPPSSSGLLLWLIPVMLLARRFRT